MNDISRTTESESAAASHRPARTGLLGSRLASLLLVLVCLAALGGLGWYFAHRNAQREASEGGANRRRPSATVAFAVAARADIPIRLEALGTVTPLAVATVRPQVSGVLQQIYYREGQIIERGKPLALIDPRPFQLALDQAVAQLARDEADLANARIILERDRTLLKQDSIAQQEVDTQQSTVKQLEGTMGSDRAAVGTARLNLDYTKVVAPIGGRVGLRPVDIGNFVQTSDTAGIATITEVTPIDVEFTLPADTVTAVQKRVNTGAVLPTTVLDRARTTSLGTGTFLTLDNQIDTQTGTVRAKARFANEQGLLFPNQFVNVQLQIDTLHQTIVVPAAAVRHGPEGDFVYVIAADDTAHVRPVKVGPQDADRTSIASGLQVGERVVTEGGDRLTDGSAVRLPGRQAPGSAQGANPNQQKRRHSHRPSGASSG